jgi:uncharacterized protein (TIGR00369 family)
MSDLLAQGRAVLDAQPFSVLLGAELTVMTAEVVVMELPIRDEHKQQFGFAHGGVVSYLADNALTYAGAAVLGSAVVTVEMKINYLRPAIGQRLIARACPVSVGQSFAVTRCDVFAVRDGREVLCAVAQGTIAKVVARSASGHRTAT